MSRKKSCRPNREAVKAKKKELKLAQKALRQRLNGSSLIFSHVLSKNGVLRKM